jgi:hypothetical protein
VSRLARVCVGTMCVATAIATASFVGCAASGDQPRIVRVATLTDMSLADFQNTVLPGTITNDRLIRFGSIGSDMFRRHTDPTNEFWMVTDRGPNGQPGGRRTFPVFEFNPTIVHVKVRGDAIDILEALPIRTLMGRLSPAFRTSQASMRPPGTSTPQANCRAIRTGWIPKALCEPRTAISGSSTNTVHRSSTRIPAAT